MRNRFDEQLDKLNRELIRMGSLCEDAINHAAKALIDNNPKVATDVNSIDGEIDQMEREIETLCLKILLQQQPVARDLRQISAALKMITDMERIGDQASDIAEIISEISFQSDFSCEPIRDMAREASQMVRRSIDAFVNRDVELAERVVSYDDVVDGYFLEVKEALIGLIREEPSNGLYAIDLMMIAKYFERIGDHATNIAEWVVFSVTGKHDGA